MADRIIVPQADPGAAYRAHKEEIDAVVLRALGSGWYVLGEEGRRFEAAFAAWLGTARAVSCGNGTDALALALRSLGIGPGCAVATVSHTAVATVAAIEMAGATPVLLDIEPDFYTMDPAGLEEVLAHPPAGLPPVRAVIPVHLYGQAADLGPIRAACARHGAVLVEDCAQAHGATLDGRRLGTFGAAAAFSLYPTKNLGALGDGGIVATNDAALADRIAALRQYGWRTHYVSDEPGVNSRLDELQAAILQVRLRHLDAGNARRRAIAARVRRGPRRERHQAARAADERDACVPSIRAPGSGPGSGSGPVAGAGDRDRHPLSGAGARAACLCGPRRARAECVPDERGGGGRGAEPADPSGADRRTDRAGRARPAGGHASSLGIGCCCL